VKFSQINLKILALPQKETMAISTKQILLFMAQIQERWLGKFIPKVLEDHLHFLDITVM
jgi:hypothetical protein